MSAASGRLRVAAGLCLAAILCAGVAVVRLWPSEVALVVRRVAAMEAGLGAAGWLLAFGVQTLVALCGVLPASAGAVAAGMAFGLAGGFCLSASATFIGAMLAFLLARSAFRPIVARSLSRRPGMARLDEAVGRDGWRLVVLMRLSPVMPFALTSYALGLTALAPRAYLLGTLASMPALLGYVGMGSLAGSGLSSLTGGGNTTLHWALLAVAFAATGLLTLHLAGIIASALRLPDRQDNARVFARAPMCDTDQTSREDVHDGEEGSGGGGGAQRGGQVPGDDARELRGIRGPAVHRPARQVAAHGAARIDHR